MFSHLSRLSSFLLCILFLSFAGFGCGSRAGDRGDFVFPGSTSADTGNVLVLHPTAEDPNLARVVKVGSDAVTTTFHGRDGQGRTVYGPTTFPSQREHLLEGLSTDVSELHIEYRKADGSLEATGRATVTIKPGETMVATAQVSKNLTFALVNDSDFEDEDVYLLLSANGKTDTGTTATQLAVYEIGTGSDSVSSLPLSQLTSNSAIVSPLTGKTLKIYEFDPTLVVSGRLWVSYGAPLTYKKGDIAPDNSETVRYDKMELGYNPASGDPTGYFDLTAVDFFALPMQLEVLANVQDTMAFRTSTFYSSTQSLLSSLNDLDPTSMSASFLKLEGEAATPGWDPKTDDLGTFLRALSPATLVSVVPPTEGAPFSPAPYPSFRAYLENLVSQGTAVTLKGANGVDGGVLTNWAYQATVSPDGTGGFLIVCQPISAMTPPPQGSLGDPNYPNDPTLPSDLTVEIPLTAEFVDQFIYGVPANAFRIKDLDCYLTPYASNSVYADIGGNILAGLNLGYVGGRYGDDGTYWFDEIPGFPPYGAARTDAKDGYYNPYAALLYNLSDAYSFSISDRLQTGNPLVTTSPDQPVLRLTLLPDERLDAPSNLTATVVAKQESPSIQVSWDASATPSTSSAFTLTGYEVTVTDGTFQVVAPNTKSPPTSMTPNHTVIETDANTFTTTVTSLNPGTAYRVSVVAKGTAGDKVVQSAEGPFVVLATDLASPTQSSGETIAYSMGVSLPADLPDGVSATVDNQTVSNTANVTLSRTKPGNEGGIVSALFKMVYQDPATQIDPLTVSLVNVPINVFPAPAPPGQQDSTAFFPYFNFPFSSSVPSSGTSFTRLLDGSQLSLAYNTAPSSTEPPFQDQSNSLVLVVTPSPSAGPKTHAQVFLPAPPPANPSPPAHPPSPPSYTPQPHNPVPCPTFKVQAVLTPDSPVSNLADLKGATVSFVRLVTYPTNGDQGPTIPGSDGSGADAASVLDEQGSATFDPSLSPYSAPIWNLGYQVEIEVNKIKYRAYGSWRNPVVNSNWTSGLGGGAENPDQPGVIYVPISASPTGQVIWGNIP